MTGKKNKEVHQKWYTNIARSIGKGIVHFLLPAIVLIFIFEKGISLAQRIIKPIQSHLPTERILGFGMFSLLSLLLILLVCYAAGVLSDRKWVKAFFGFAEDNLFIFIPGYAMIPGSADAGIETADTHWTVVMIDDDGDRMYGIEVDKRRDGYSMIFFPEPPDAKSGDMKLMPESKFRRIDFSVNKPERIVRNYGHGSEDIPNYCRQLNPGMNHSFS